MSRIRSLRYLLRSLPLALERVFSQPYLFSGKSIVLLVHELLQFWVWPGAHDEVNVAAPGNAIVIAARASGATGRTRSTPVLADARNYNGR